MESRKTEIFSNFEGPLLPFVDLGFEKQTLPLMRLEQDYLRPKFELARTSREPARVWHSEGTYLDENEWESIHPSRSMYLSNAIPSLVPWRS